jgi:hypothetical protein
MDVSEVGMKQFWDLKKHLQECSEMATGFYPETLEMIFVSVSRLFTPILAIRRRRCEIPY